MWEKGDSHGEVLMLEYSNLYGQLLLRFIQKRLQILKQNRGSLGNRQMCGVKSEELQVWQYIYRE